MHSDVQQVLFTKADIDTKVAELGEKLTRDYQDLNPLCICVLKGAMIFTADLIRYMDISLQIDMMAVSSYGSSTSSSGVVQIIKDLETPVQGRHLLIIEDIVDTGLTLRYLYDLLQGRGPASIKVVSLLDKPSKRKVPFQPDYIGFSILDQYVIGYGFDSNQKYRNLPYIGALKKELYRT